MSLQGMIRLAHAPMPGILESHWARGEPDLVVSLVPNFNRVLCEPVAAALPGVSCATALTDLADHPPQFWVEPGQDQTCDSRRRPWPIPLPLLSWRGFPAGRWSRCRTCDHSKGSRTSKESKRQ
jgi:hypothetical protein